MSKAKKTFVFIFQIYEPLVFGFALFILFSHVQDITENAETYTIAGLWRSFMTDVGNYFWTVWFFLFLAVILWIVGRIVIYRWERQEREKDQKKDDRLHDDIQSLIQEIRQDRDERNNKS